MSIPAFTEIVNTGKKSQVTSHVPGKGDVQRNVYQVKRTYVETMEINREILLFKRVQLQEEMDKIDATLLQMPESEEPVDPSKPEPAP